MPGNEDLLAGFDPVEHIALPITPARGTLSLKGKDKVGGALQADPQGLRSRKAVAGAVEEPPEGSHQADHGVERWRLRRRRLMLGEQIDGFPFGLLEDDIAGHRQTVPPAVGEQQDTPGDDHGEGDGRLQAVAALQL
jgi:hypothetical protein